jgi:hypothetical protein
MHCRQGTTPRGTNTICKRGRGITGCWSRIACARIHVTAHHARNLFSFESRLEMGGLRGSPALYWYYIIKLQISVALLWIDAGRGESRRPLSQQLITCRTRLISPTCSPRRHQLRRMQKRYLSLPSLIPRHQMLPPLLPDHLLRPRFHLR